MGARRASVISLMKTSITVPVHRPGMGVPSPSRVLLVAACVLSVALLAMPPVAATVDEDEVRLAPGHSVEVRIDHNSSLVGLVVYWVEVRFGPPVNVWFVPEEGWEEFHDPAETSFRYYPDASVANTTEVIDFNLELEETGVYYLIIEHPDSIGGEDESFVYYRVEYDVDRSAISGLMLGILVVAVVAAALFIVAFNVAVRRTEAKKELDERDANVKLMQEMMGEKDKRARARPRPEPPPVPPPTPPSIRPPEPPPAYSERVVRESMAELGHDADEAWEE